MGSHHSTAVPNRICATSSNRAFSMLTTNYFSSDPAAKRSSATVTSAA